MTVTEQVPAALRGSGAELTDAEIARLVDKGHQHVNQTCRRLAEQGLIVRDSSLGSITKRVATDPPTRARSAMRPQSAPVAEDRSREGNVQSRVVAYLAGTGWTIVSVADTARRDHGIDVVAEQDGVQLMVGAKGWPSTTYARGKRAGQLKPTQPNLQATHWFAEGLATLIRRGAEPNSRLALALPDMPRYRSLRAEAGWALRRLNMIVYLVEAAGSVQTWEGAN